MDGGETEGKGSSFLFGFHRETQISNCFQTIPFGFFTGMSSKPREKSDHPFRILRTSMPDTCHVSPDGLSHAAQCRRWARGAAGHPMFSNAGHPMFSFPGPSCGANKMIKISIKIIIK